MEYKGIIKKRKTWLTVLFVILACLMLWRTIVTQHWSYLPIVILVILACFFTKEQIFRQCGHLGPVLDIGAELDLLAGICHAL